ncbi:MAG: ATP-binding protein [Clostridiaceae bacterium]|nr:ATP-binding protein [Clostridiaceae bacterium]
MKDLSLHILDIIQNSIKAESTLIEVEISEDTKEDLLTITIKDNGRGMDEELLKKVLDPFVTTRTTRKVGLGLSLFKASCEQAEGSLTVDSVLGKATIVYAKLKHSHIDRKPIGDIASTMALAISSNENIDFIYKHKVDGNEFLLDTREIKKELDGVSVALPEVTCWIKDYIEEGIKNINGGNDL